MTSDLETAFELPEARAAATSSDDPLDRIAVRDYLREVEIGAFQAERGTTQRIRFNVVVEVASSAAAQFDDVDQVLSYDTITEAIENQLALERLNLLETLAERIADEILTHKRAVRVFVRIEKLDRIPGTLGVEIVRNRIEMGEISQISPTPEVEPEQINPLVVFMSNQIVQSDQLAGWLDAIERQETPAIIMVDRSHVAPPISEVEAADQRIGLLALEQAAWVLAGKDRRCVVVNSRTELDWAIKQDQMSVWAPSKMVLDAVNKPDVGPDAPLELAHWLADEFGSDAPIVLGQGAIQAPSDLFAA